MLRCTKSPPLSSQENRSDFISYVMQLFPKKASEPADRSAHQANQPHRCPNPDRKKQQNRKCNAESKIPLKDRHDTHLHFYVTISIS